MRKYRITVDGKTYEMEIELVDEKELNAAEKKQNIQAPIKSENIKASQSSSTVSNNAVSSTNQQPAGNGTVTSPMPGSITKVNAETGTIVSKGQNILVLEAMKMENEIAAPKAGKLVKLYVKQGDTVQGGDPLFEIEA